VTEIPQSGAALAGQIASRIGRTGFSTIILENQAGRQVIQRR